MTPSRVDTTRPHPARVYDYWLGGKNNYEVDEAAAEQVRRVWPSVGHGARHNRAFMHRAVHHLAAEAGIRQFLDIGTGIPTEPNLHQIAQSVDPTARVVYVDNDPLVQVYASALLRSTPEGRLAYLHADATDVRSVVEAPEFTDTIDLDEPVALSLVALLHLVSDERGAHELVRGLLDVLPSGSYLMLAHATAELNPRQMAAVAELYGRSTTTGGQLRSHAELLTFFDGMDLVPPGLVVTHRWRPRADDGLPAITDAEMCAYAGVARKR